MEFRQPYDENYNPADYSTPVGYELDSDPDKQLQNALEASATEQAHATDSDINVIMLRYQKTGVLPQGNGGTLVFGDLSDVPTYLEAQIILANANESFAQLPANVRERFMNDPSKFLAFMEDDSNYDEAVKLGLVVKPVQPAAETRAEPVAKATETPPAA